MSQRRRCPTKNEAAGLASKEIPHTCTVIMLVIHDYSASAVDVQQKGLRWTRKLGQIDLQGTD